MAELKKILIVDDDWDVVQLCQLAFQLAGFQVGAASTGPQALKMMAADMPDLILLDVMMPGMTGIDVCAEIRKQFPNDSPYILMYTADYENRVITRQKSIAAGANELITKETSGMELAEAVHIYFSNHNRGGNGR